jgi:hypothetical protein
MAGTSRLPSLAPGFERVHLAPLSLGEKARWISQQEEILSSKVAALSLALWLLCTHLRVVFLFFFSTVQCDSQGWSRRGRDWHAGQGEPGCTNNPRVIIIALVGWMGLGSIGPIHHRPTNRVDRSSGSHRT